MIQIWRNLVLQFEDGPGEIVEQLISFYNVPAEKQVSFLYYRELLTFFLSVTFRLYSWFSV